MSVARERDLPVPGLAGPGTGPDVFDQFPVLRREFDGRRIVYLDSAATSPTPQVVIDAIVDYYTNHRASVHRGVYPLIVEATDMYEGARERIAAWLGSTPRAANLSGQPAGPVH